MSFNINDIKIYDGWFDGRLKFIGYFKNQYYGIQLINCLIEKKYVTDDTNIGWQDKKAGFKSTLLSILFDVHKRGYFKDYITPDPVFVEIAYEVFLVSISKSLIKNFYNKNKRVHHGINLDTDPFSI